MEKKGGRSFLVVLPLPEEREGHRSLSGEQSSSALPRSSYHAALPPDDAPLPGRSPAPGKHNHNNRLDHHLVIIITVIGRSIDDMIEIVVVIIVVVV